MYKINSIRSFYLTKILIIFMSVMPTYASQEIDILIQSPHNQAEVDRPAKVEGTVSNINANIYLIVHPEGVPEYWVQPRAIVNEKGIWTSKVYLGRPENVDPKKYYEIMAVANPISSIKESDVLKNWPTAKGASQIIQVRRKITTFNKPTRLHGEEEKKLASKSLDGNDMYEIQVGSWRNVNFANKIFRKLIKLYPDTILIENNDLNKIMIPGIRTKKEGQRIIGEIETAFNLTPLLRVKK